MISNCGWLNRVFLFVRFHNILENKKSLSKYLNQNCFCPISSPSSIDIGRAHQVHILYLLPDCTSAAEILDFSGTITSPKWWFFKVVFS
jgi:hypothetical protein